MTTTQANQLQTIYNKIDSVINDSQLINFGTGSSLNLTVKKKML